MCALLSTVLLFVWHPLGVFPQEDAKKDQNILQGTWTIEEFTANG
jgi:hypothetical protein